MGEAAIHQFGNILLGGRGGTNPGQLKIHSGGFLWKKTGGGKVVEVAKADIQSITWTRVPNAYQLGVRLKAGSNVKFNGFREQDVSTISSFVSSNMGVSPEDLPLALSGRNWGEIELKGNTLAFMVGGKQGFEISVADVSQTQVQGKNDVLMEFHVDDTASVNEKDTLMELSFHIPNNNTTFIGDEERPSAQVFCDRILSMADVGPSGADAIALFEEVGILTPRGRYNVELHLSFLRLQGQANDFKIQYASVVRLFILPKANQSYTYDVITLDPPIRKGQTFYPHIVLQFPTEEIAECTLSMSPELLESKYKDRLQPAYKGLSHEVFGQILRGLSGAKVTRPGKFRSSQDSYAVRASLKAEEGTLYPLEKSFFFLPKPPTLILHDEIEYVEFERHGAGNSISSKNFDLIIRLKSDQEHQFRNIMRNEYHNLFRFVSSKELKILNVDPQGTSAVVEALQGSDDEGVDPHLNRIKSARESGAAGDGGDSDEEDEDFVADRDDAGSPTDESDEEGGGNASNSSGGEEEEEEEEEDKPVKKKEKKSEVAPKASTQKRKSRKDDDEDGGKKKKRKKKDPNAPKRALSGFFYFSMAEREIMKKTNPNVGFKDMGRVLGEKWRNMSAEEKEPYEVKARLDKERYKEEMAGYSKAGGVVANDSAGSEEEE